MGFKDKLLVGLLLAAAVISTAQARGFFSWTDAQGNVHYGDQVPPSDSQTGHKVIDSDGQVVDRVAPRKSASQLERERRELERLAAEDRLRREQQIRDTTLLSTFSSVQEIDRIRDQRVSTLDSLITLGRKKVGTLSDKLESAERRRARIESDGAVVPNQLSENIAVLNQQIVHQENKISEYHAKKADIVEAFRIDRERYVELTSQSKTR